MRAALIAEPSAPVSTALRRFLESADYEVIIVGTAGAALREVRGSPPTVLIASQSPALDGEALCREVKQEAPAVPVLLLYMPEEENPEQRAAQAGADACLVGPLKRTTVVTCVGLLMQLIEARAAARFTDAPTSDAADAREAEALKGRMEGPGSPDFEFLKRLLLMEVKRSRRYRYPIALLLMELDHLTERTGNLSPTQRTAMLAEMLGLLSGGVRDIDVIVPTAEGRFVAFLPHTPRTGALVVAERLRQRVKTLAPLPNITVSMGLSVFEPSPVRGQTQVSFGNLMKDASEALRKAQSGGGDRLEVAERTAERSKEEAQSG